MSPEGPAGQLIDGAVLNELPIGVAVFDAAGRVVLMNAAYHQSLALPPGSITPGTKLEETLRRAALRGVFGPGDPEKHVRAALRQDRSSAGRLRRRSFAGRTYDLFSAPLPAGGHVVCAVEITAQLSARLAVEAMAARLTGALNGVRTGIAIFDNTPALLFANPRFASLLGLPVDLLRRGMSVTEIAREMAQLDEYAGPEGAQFLRARREMDRRVVNIMQHHRPNGDVTELVTEPLPDGGWSITASDVTAMVNAAHEASSRARMLDGLLDAIPHGICVYGPDRRVTMFNRAYADIMRGAPLSVGDSLDEVIGRRAEAGEYGASPPAEQFRTEMAHDLSRQQARRRVRPNGITIDVRTAPLPDGGHVSVVTDETPLMAAEAARLAHARTMEVMLANIQHGIMFWSAERRLVGANDMAARLTGFDRTDLQPGLAYDDFLRHQHARGAFGAGADADALLEGLLAHDRRQPLVNRRRWGKEGMLETRSEPTPDGGFVVTFTDISASERIAEDLRQAKEAAEAATASKARFLATMSHELRTPLNAVIGFSDTLMRDRGATDPAQVREYAEDINISGKRLLVLINNMLDVARIEAGRFDLASDQVNVHRMVQACLRQHRAAAAAADVDLLDELPSELPPVRGDERRLQQVLGNLLSNAVKFTEPGGAVRVDAEVDTHGDLLLQVHDSGIGIAADQLERVFEPFTQLDGGLDRRHEGAGLGLYFSRALVAAHGGTLTLRSQRGEGTTAEIRLPGRRMANGT